MDDLNPPELHKEPDIFEKIDIEAPPESSAITMSQIGELVLKMLQVDPESGDYHLLHGLFLGFRDIDSVRAQLSDEPRQLMADTVDKIRQVVEAQEMPQDPHLMCTEIEKQIQIFVLKKMCLHEE